MFENIIEDLDIYCFRRRWSKWLIILVPFIFITTWPGICYRYQHWVVTKVKIPVVKQVLIILGYFWKLVIVITTNITISEHAKIGKGLFIAHVGNIVISHKTKIGNYCSLHQGVTIGDAGIGDDNGSPSIGDNVYISTGAVIVGKISIGNNVAIGANAVVLKSVPDTVSLGGVPAKVISYKGSFGMIHYRKKST